MHKQNQEALSHNIDGTPLLYNGNIGFLTCTYEYKWPEIIFHLYTREIRDTFSSHQGYAHFLDSNA